ncbi:probable methyltransferase-like protein 24 [Littorina saxatilis]|uniref:probable methyltransferase-like protein 24 n=1 Tax=Littorina saxatilis TaxID=31220 RepID=UPI0038B4D1BE
MTVDSHQHSSKVTYYKIGLGGEGGKLEEVGEKLKSKNHWRVESFSDIKTLLGHKDKILDVVKIDIEASEWPALAHMAQTGELNKVRQLLMEFHVFGGKDAEVIRRRLAVIRMLEKAGFRVFYTWQYAGWPGIERMTGTYPVMRTITYEVSFVNINLARP